MKADNQNSFFLLGEAVVDLISTEIVNNLEEASCFQKFAGGEVANLAMNLSRLGFPAVLGACVGQDSFGSFLQDQYAEAGVILDYLQITEEAPTTIIPVARQTDTPDFMVYRGADRYLKITDGLLTGVENCKAIHTSAFALSQDPCRSTILSIIESTLKTDMVVSFDPNYHPGIWPDLPDYKSFLKDFYQHVTITKPSLDDSIRFFGPKQEPIEYLERFLSLGPEIVVLTMGSRGVLLGTSTGDRVHIHANLIPVVDVTGAGDAFWSGLLTGLLEGMSPVGAARLGQAIAEFKIGILGPVKQFLTMEEFKKTADKVSVSTIQSKTH